MQCPACGETMVRQNFGVEVDVCGQGCHGIWFDRGELARLDEKNAGVGAALEAALRLPRKIDSPRDPLVCSKCSTPMHCHKYRRAKEVNVDECYLCGGFFLDSGELGAIRDRRMTDAEIAAYRNAILAGIPDYAQSRLDLHAKQQRSEAIHVLSKLLMRRYGYPLP